MAIIIDNKNEKIDGVVLSDDGTGAGISIPSMMINRHQGEILKKFIIKHSKNHKKEKDTQDEKDENEDEEEEDEDEFHYATLYAEFFMDYRTDNRVDVDFFYTTSDDKSLDLLKNLADYMEPLLRYIDFKPRMVSWPCP